MGKDHSVAWYRITGKGRTSNTSIGHDVSDWKQNAFVRMLANVVNEAKNQIKK
jgi:type 1 glutamine amidotransferase